MSDIETILADIERKATRLLDENGRLRVREEKLTGQLKELQEQIKQQNTTISTLKEENKLLKLGEKLTQRGDTTEMKLRINQLIRSIDKSLAMINETGAEATAQPEEE
jgi:predicted nuclease with TOPRIM domain